MARRERDSTVLPTIWHAPDDLWDKIKSILDEHDRRKHMGRKRIDQRGALDGIIFRMRSGCQWNQLPREYPDDSSVHLHHDVTRFDSFVAGHWRSTGGDATPARSRAGWRRP